MSNDETNVERMRRALENQVRERLEKRISTRIQCDPPVAKVSDTIVVRADMMAPPTIAAQFKPVVRCVEVEGFGKRMLKRRGSGQETKFPSRPGSAVRSWGSARFACRFMLFRKQPIQSATAAYSYSQGRRWSQPDAR